MVIKKDKQIGIRLSVRDARHLAKMSRRKGKTLAAYVRDGLVAAIQRDRETRMCDCCPPEETGTAAE